jgi:hypothetical protein
MRMSSFLPIFTINGAPVEWNRQGKSDNSEKNLSQCHFVHHKSHMDLTWDRTRASVVRDGLVLLKHPKCNCFCFISYLNLSLVSCRFSNFLSKLPLCRRLRSYLLCWISNLSALMESKGSSHIHQKIPKHAYLESSSFQLKFLKRQFRKAGYRHKTDADRICQFQLSHKTQTLYQF